MSANRFRNELLSIATANPGWHVHIREDEVDTTTRQRISANETKHVLVAWAVVKVWWADGSQTVQTEPVFLSHTGPVHTTEYRRIHSDLDSPIKTTIAITVVPPASLALVGL